MSKILLIEPDGALAKIYAQALKVAKHEVYLCSNAQMAVHAADKRTPELVIMEVQMAGHNGLEFLYEFRSYKEWQETPVLLHTLMPPEEFYGSITTWQELKVVGYMYKPRTSLKQLLLLIDSTLSSEGIVVVNAE